MGQWQKRHPTESACQNCAELFAFENDEHAKDYVGTYSAEEECVNYPADNPRICLKYEPRTLNAQCNGAERRLSDEVECPVIAQMEKGECHDDLHNIPAPQLDSCNSNGEQLFGAMEMLKRSMAEEEDENELAKMKKEKTEILEQRLEMI